MIKQQDFTARELARFRDVQRLAYACVEQVGAQLEAGMTEKDAVTLMEAWLRESGVTTFFHKPFAWFGDRTAFAGFWNDFQFFPTNRKLEHGMPVILDVAPLVDGYVADIGWSTFFGEESPEYKQLKRDLIAYRALILDGVKAGRTFRDIYQDVDALIARQGYVSAHRKYPQRVLAHRVAKIEESWWTNRHLFGFGLDQFTWLVPQGLRARLNPAQNESPLWNDGIESDHKPQPGVWAVEPHLDCHGIGAKWEEILVITEDDAYWLDEETPHMIEARARGWVGRKAAAKPAAKKAPPKKAVPKKTATQKAAAKKVAPGKISPQRAPTKKVSAKKASTKKTGIKKAAAKKSVIRKQTRAT